MSGKYETPEESLERLLSTDSTPSSGTPGDDLALLAKTADDLRQEAAAIPAPERGDGALTRMLNELENAKMNPTRPGLMTLLAGWWARPAMRTGLAAVAAVAVVGGAGFGAAAATGNAGPVRNLLGISSDSAIRVELRGIVVSIDGNTVLVDANGDVRSVTVDAGTKITAGDDDDAQLAVTDIIVGGAVEVRGRLLADNSILATRVQLEDDISGSPTAGVPTQGVPTSAPSTPNAAPTSNATPGTVPTNDDQDDDDGDDNSGPGSGDDDGENDDNSGPGSGDDDGENDDNSGPGSGDDDGENDDNSGPGSGDDDGAGENSGPGSSDDDGDDDSGSGSSDDGGDN